MSHSRVFGSFFVGRPAVNVSHFASGDQPCMYEGESGVMRFGTPPRVDIVKMVDCPPSVLWSLIASWVPSKDNTWSLLLRIAKPVSMSVVVRVARSKRHRRPRMAGSLPLAL